MARTCPPHCPDRPWVVADQLPARRGPEPFVPNELRAESRVPRVTNDPWATYNKIREVSATVPPAILRAILEAPGRTAGALAEGDIDRAIFEGTGIRMGRLQPRTTGERIGQAFALGTAALPALKAGRGVARAEAQVTQGLRNADRYRRASTSALNDFETTLQRFDPSYVPAFERAGGRTRQFGDLLTLKPGELNPSLPAAIREGFGAGGFTLDRTGKPFAGDGFAVALRKLTLPVDRANQDAMLRFLARPDVQAELAEPGRYIGGWCNPANGKCEINITRIVGDRKQAAMLARRNKQLSYGEFRDGTYTGDHQFVQEAVIQGADGKWYGGVNHGDAEGYAARMLRSTPEGMEAMRRNSGSAKIRGSDAFRRSDNKIISREESRIISEAETPQLAPQWTQLHSSDLDLNTKPRPTDPDVAPRGEQHAPAPNVLRTSARSRALMEALLPDEEKWLSRSGMQRIGEIARDLDSPEVFGSGAIAGAAKMGWYENSARALTEVFGPDAPRFAALLAALSPNQPVSRNLEEALNLWEAWTNGGRALDTRAIRRYVDDAVAKDRPAKYNNVLRALTSEDPAALSLSGPKVFNFHRNLIGESQRVTLDTWMRKLGGLPENALGGVSRAGVDISGPNPTYLAFSGRIRQTADHLSKLTGRRWTPAEVQETLWSWGKALTETAEPAMRGQHPNQLGLFGPLNNFKSAIPLVTQSKIRAAPDFATLLNEAPFTESLQRQGLPLPVPRSSLPPPFLPEPDRGLLGKLARNLQGLNQRMGRRGALGGSGRPQKAAYTSVSGKIYTGNDHTEALFHARDAGEPELQGYPDADFSGEQLRSIEERMGYTDVQNQFLSRDQAETFNIWDSSDLGNAALPMLGLSGGAALGGLTLWEYLRNR